MSPPLQAAREAGAAYAGDPPAKGDALRFEQLAAPDRTFSRGVGVLLGDPAGLSEAAWKQLDAEPFDLATFLENCLRLNHAMVLCELPLLAMQTGMLCTRVLKANTELDLPGKKRKAGGLDAGGV